MRAPAFKRKIERDGVMLKTVTFFFWIVLMFGVDAANGQCPPGRLSLLRDYSCKRDHPTGVATTSGEISAPGGLRIRFEQGPSQGYAASESEVGKYDWFYEKKINGASAKFALIRKGVRTVWEPHAPRDKTLGSILIASFPIGNDAHNVINFVCEIVTEKDLADALVTLLAYDPIS